MKLNLADIASVVSGAASSDATITSVSIDSRTLSSGALYIALHGEQFDGHQFVEAAAAEGAVAAIVSESGNYSIPVIQVADTQQALVALACWYRDQFTLPTIAITGSVGKTTTRALTASIFSEAGKTLASVGSFNNHIGVPLTMLRLQQDDQYYVQEMGANHVGEIADLVHWAKPTVAMITCAAPVHLEGFGSMDGVAKGKGEIYQGLPQDGIAIVNSDDAYADYWRELIGERRIVTFGVQTGAMITARDIQLNAEGQPSFVLQTPDAETTIQLPLAGKHNVMNALAATAAAWALQIPLNIIQQGLQATEPVSKRLNMLTGLHGCRIINDSYNANPTALLAAFDVLDTFPGKKILVLGQMGELGDDAARYHAEAGKAAREHGIERLYAFGELCQHAVSAFGAHAYYFSDRAELAKALKPEVDADTVLLVKGSKSNKMWEVAEALQSTN